MAVVDCVSVEKKRTAEDFYYRVVSAYSHFGYVTATHTGYFPQTRHNSAAQIFYPCRVFTSCGCSRLAQENVLCGTGMPRLRGVNRLCSSTVAEMRICGYHAVVKILCRSPFFAAVSSLPLPPCPQRKGRSSKRKGNHRCPFLFVPAPDGATPPTFSLVQCRKMRYTYFI